MASQMVDDICVDNYKTPIDHTAGQISQLKHTYLFAVFNHTLKTSYTSQLVTTYAKDTNKASLIWVAVVEHASQSTNATVSAQDLLEYITHVLVTNWKGTTQNFVLNWLGQVCKCHQIAGEPDKMGDTTLFCLLHETVCPIESLHNVENMVNILKCSAALHGYD